MVCGCCGGSKKEEDEGNQRAPQTTTNQDVNHNFSNRLPPTLPMAPSSVRMSRGDPVTEEDIAAVKMWRNRSSESLRRSPTVPTGNTSTLSSSRLSVDSSSTWVNDWQSKSPQREYLAQGRNKKNMATVESVEIDELSTYSPSPFLRQMSDLKSQRDDDSTRQNQTPERQNPLSEISELPEYRVFEVTGTPKPRPHWETPSIPLPEKQLDPTLEDTIMTPTIKYYESTSSNNGASTKHDSVDSKPSPFRSKTPLTESTSILSGDSNSRAQQSRPPAILTKAPSLRKIPSDDQSLGTIDGVAVDELDAIVKAVEERQSRTPSPALSSQGSRIWSPATVQASGSGPSHASSYRTSPKAKQSRSEVSAAKSNASSAKSVASGSNDDISTRFITGDRSTRSRGSSELSLLRSNQSNIFESQMMADQTQGADVSLDALSDIPSDIDSDTREQYLLACRLLKSALLQKDKALDPVEKEFLRGLVRDTPARPSKSHITAVRRASEKLQSDPLFRSPSNRSSDDASTGIFSTLSEDDIVKRKQVATYADDGSKQYHFRVLGNTGVTFQVLTPRVMEALRGFMPVAISEENFWLKFSLDRDGGSLITLLSKVRMSKHTILSVETTTGFVFGVFCSSPWRVQRSWFGSGECFLWRLKHPRRANKGSSRKHLSDNEMEVYPFTGHDRLVQFVTNQTLAVGGGDWDSKESTPFPNEPTGIGFTIDGDLLGGETNSCATFASPRLCGNLSNNTEFEIESLEVWTLTPCSNLEDAERLETRKFFVEKNIL